MPNTGHKNRVQVLLRFFRNRKSALEESHSRKKEHDMVVVGRGGCAMVLELNDARRRSGITFFRTPSPSPAQMIQAVAILDNVVLAIRRELSRSWHESSQKEKSESCQPPSPTSLSLI
jgi:hypothetical protein